MLNRGLMSLAHNALRPVVAVIGTTGVGKSQLAVHLAKSLQDAQLPVSKGLVLSADSMQLYKGLDVITNKVTTEEMEGIEHWGLNLISPENEGSWVVGKWCSEAAAKIKGTAETILPIVCGGTHYFIQHFLFPPSDLSMEVAETESNVLRWRPPHPCPTVDGLSPAQRRLLTTFWTDTPAWPLGSEGQDRSEDQQTEAGPSRQTRPTTIDDSHLLDMHSLLETVDPAEAARWHWKDGRKVRRALERWWERDGQDESENGSHRRRARFRILLFWVYEPPDVLEPRLDQRVDKMIESGLLDEILELRKIASNRFGTIDATDYAEGIFQSIGYKEFAELPLPLKDPHNFPGFSGMVDVMKTRTRRYARYQLKWIRKQILPVIREARNCGDEVEIFVVPGGHTGHSVAEPLLHAFLQAKPLPTSASVSSPHASELLAALHADSDAVPDPDARRQIHARTICQVCSTADTPTSVPKAEWEEHLLSKKHRKAERVRNGHPSKAQEAQKARQEEIRAHRARLRGESATESH